MNAEWSISSDFIETSIKKIDQHLLSAFIYLKRRGSGWFDATEGEVDEFNAGIQAFRRQVENTAEDVECGFEVEKTKADTAIFPLYEKLVQQVDLDKYFLLALSHYAFSQKAIEDGNIESGIEELNAALYAVGIFHGIKEQCEHSGREAENNRAVQENIQKGRSKGGKAKADKTAEVREKLSCLLHEMAKKRVFYNTYKEAVKHCEEKLDNELSVPVDNLYEVIENLRRNNEIIKMGFLKIYKKAVFYSENINKPDD